MNPIIRAMMMRVGSAGRFMNTASAGSSGSDMLLKAPDGRSWQEIMQGQSPNTRVADAFHDVAKGDRTQLSPIDRIKQAFDALHSNNLVPANSAGVFGPDAVMTGGPGAPGPMDLASHGVVNVPDKVAPSMPADPQQSPMGFFLRNALAQKDQESGQYLNPNIGAQAMASPFKGLFG